MAFTQYLGLPFAQHALLAAALVAIACGLIGPFVTSIPRESLEFTLGAMRAAIAKVRGCPWQRCSTRSRSRGRNFRNWSMDNQKTYRDSF